MGVGLIKQTQTVANAYVGDLLTGQDGGLLGVLRLGLFGLFGRILRNIGVIRFLEAARFIRVDTNGGESVCVRDPRYEYR